MRRALLSFALALALPAAAHAQSLFSTRGLGVPTDAVDARARALGGIGVGLLGVNPSLVSPAELGGILRRGVSATLQPVAHSQTLGDESASVSASRFPLIGIMYPLNNRLVLGVAYGGYLEQSWGISQSGTIDIEGDQVEVFDVVRSTGGLGQVRASAAYLVTPSLSVGITGGVVTGNVERVAARSFNDSTRTLRNFSTRTGWEYGGLLGGVGARWDINPALRVGASVLLTGDVDADSAFGAAAPRAHGSGLQLAGGASGRINADLMLALGVIRERYPDVDIAGESARETWTFGGGLEYTGLRAGARGFPLRLGARLQELPYHGTGEEPAKEVSGTLGVGFRLAGDAIAPLAVVDLGIERARRTGLASTALGSGLEDDMWRFTFSLSLFGR